jgi:hypothetical protein
MTTIFVVGELDQFGTGDRRESDQPAPSGLTQHRERRSGAGDQVQSLHEVDGEPFARVNRDASPQKPS